MSVGVMAVGVVLDNIAKTIGIAGGSVTVANGIINLLPKKAPPVPLIAKIAPWAAVVGGIIVSVKVCTDIDKNIKETRLMMEKHGVGTTK